MALRKRFQWLALIAVTLIGGAWVYRLQFHKSIRQVSYSEFLAEARSGHLAEVHFGETDLVGLVRPEKDRPAVPEMAARRLPGVDLSEFLKELEKARIPVAAAKDGAAAWAVVVGWVFSALFLFSIGVLVFWRT